MKAARRLLKDVVALGFVLVGAGISCGAIASPEQGEVALKESKGEAPTLTIAVDPRVELLSLIFHLAGNPEYNMGRVACYLADVDKQFGQYREHELIKFAIGLRERKGVSYDACMSLAAHLTDVSELTLIVPLEPWPEGLDKRWTPQDVSRFLQLGRKFAKDTSFSEFVEQHRGLYETTENRMKSLMQKHGHLEWFQDFFGERAEASFSMVPGLLNGGGSYGVHVSNLNGRDALYCILGVWNMDTNGLPDFPESCVSTIVHEFGHSYANPIIHRHYRDMADAGGDLFRRVAKQMRSQAYGNGQTMLCESLVRACEARYALRYGGEEAQRRSVAYNKGRGFLWMEELTTLLGEYEANREKFPTLEAFSPRIVTFFNEYAADFERKEQEGKGN